MGRRTLTKISEVFFDVDGVFTTGQFLYTKMGKFAKIFGPHDADGIKLLRPHVKISAITADQRGFCITEKRIATDMNIPLLTIPETSRKNFFLDRSHRQSIIYMGDGPYDIPVFRAVGFGIAPANAWPATKKAADLVTTLPGGQGAVAEACWYILTKLLKHKIVI